jgi:hypothetical protein
MAVRFPYQVFRGDRRSRISGRPAAGAIRRAELCIDEIPPRTPAGPSGPEAFGRGELSGFGIRSNIRQTD